MCALQTGLSNPGASYNLVEPAKMFPILAILWELISHVFPLRHFAQMTNEKSGRDADLRGHNDSTPFQC